MKTNRDLALYKPSLGYTLNVPAGADVMMLSGMGADCYAIAHPATYGASNHDATHYYFYIPADAVSHD